MTIRHNQFTTRGGLFSAETTFGTVRERSTSTIKFSPTKPSERQRQLHELTHHPFRNLCSECAESRWGAYTISRASGSTTSDSDGLWLLIGTRGIRTRRDDLISDRRSNTDVLSDVDYGVTDMARMIDDMGRTGTIIQTDVENAIKAWNKALCRKSPGL